ncbi:M56 family metallopeptidase [Tissierellaceae bacterium HCP3S3_D8]
MTKLSYLEISIISCLYISLVLIVRKILNNKSFKYASIILWGLIILRLMFPYSIRISLQKIDRKGILFQVINSLIDFMIDINQFKKVYLIDNIDRFFPKINRVIVVLLIGVYIIFRIIRATRAISNSSVVKDDKYIDEFLRGNRLNRKVQVLVNDNLKYPITYGIIKPKIIIQSELIQERDMLEYILIHEMVHIRRFDIMLNHLKNILICIHWYNPLVWAMAIYLDEDIEVLCDKLVIDKVGNSEENKRDYCMTMLNLIKEKENKKVVGLGLHPSLERMIVLKNWKVKRSGIFLGILMLCIVSTSFVSAEENTIPITTSSDMHEEERIINVDNRTREITDEEYDESYGEDKNNIRPMKADISDSTTVEAFGGSKNYTFNMTSWTGPSHKRFVTNIKNTYSKGDIDFKLIIEEDGNIIYSKSHKGDIRLETTDAKDNRKYRVTIVNTSNRELSYDISIVSHER